MHHGRKKIMIICVKSWWSAHLVGGDEGEQYSLYIYAAKISELAMFSLKEPY